MVVCDMRSIQTEFDRVENFRYRNRTALKKGPITKIGRLATQTEISLRTEIARIYCNLTSRQRCRMREKREEITHDENELYVLHDTSLDSADPACSG